MRPSTPAASARRASSGSTMPLSRTGSLVRERSQSIASHPGAAAASGVPNSRASGGGGQAAHALQVHRLHPRREGETGALFAVPHAVHRRVDRDDERAIAGPFGAAHQCFGEIAVGLDIELEPQRRRRLFRDRFEIEARLRADHHRQPGRPGREHRRQFAVGMRHALERHRREQDWRGELAAQQAGARRRPRQVAQHARPQRQAVERRLIFAQRPFVARAAREIGPGGIRQPLARQRPIIGDRGDVRRHAFERRQRHVSDHSRSRLW